MLTINININWSGVKTIVRVGWLDGFARGRLLLFRERVDFIVRILTFKLIIGHL